MPSSQGRRDEESCSGATAATISAHTTCCSGPKLSVGGPSTSASGVPIPITQDIFQYMSDTASDVPAPNSAEKPAAISNRSSSCSDTRRSRLPNATSARNRRSPLPSTTASDCKVCLRAFGSQQKTCESNELLIFTHVYLSVYGIKLWSSQQRGNEHRRFLVFRCMLTRHCQG